jgi:hypothetical protein
MVGLKLNFSEQLTNKGRLDGLVNSKFTKILARELPDTTKQEQAWSSGYHKKTEDGLARLERKDS